MQVNQIQSLIDEDEWKAVAAIARELAAADTSEAHPAKKASDVDDLEEIRDRVTELVGRIAPEEIVNVNIMMAEFEGRERDLMDQLTLIHERNIAHASRLVSQSNAKKAVREEIKAKRASVPVTALDVDQAVARRDWAGLKAMGFCCEKFEDSQRTVKLSSSNSQKSDLIISLFKGGEKGGIAAACDAFASSE